MRRILILLSVVAVATAFASCGKGDKWSQRTLDINVRESVDHEADEHLTPAQIVRKAYSLDMSNGIDAFHGAQGMGGAKRHC
jgi:hypothetical protein